MSDHRRSSHGTPSPRMHAAERAMERAERAGSVVELIHGHAPAGPVVGGYRWFTNRMIRTHAPPGALQHPMVQRTLGWRNLFLSAVGLTITALGVVHLARHRHDMEHLHGGRRGGDGHGGGQG